MTWMKKNIGKLLLFFLLFSGSILFSVFVGSPLLALSGLISEDLGLLPDLVPGDMFSDILAKFISLLPAGIQEEGFVLIAALLFSSNLLLIGLITYNSIREIFTTESRSDAELRILSFFGALIASLCLAFSVPFCRNSLMLDSSVIDVVLVLVVSYVLTRYWIGGKFKILLLGAFLYSLASVQVTALLVMLPLAATWALLSMMKHNQLAPRSIVLTILCGFTGLTVAYSMASLLFMGTEGAHLRGGANFGIAVLLLARDHVTFLARATGQSGWIAFHLMTALPWLCVLLAVRKIGKEDRDWTDIVYYLISTFIPFMVFLRFPEKVWLSIFAPVHMVTPYAAIAFSVGLAFPLWFYISHGGYNVSSTSGISWLLKWLAYAVQLCLLLCVLCMPIRNFALADLRAGRYIESEAKALFKDIADLSRERLFVVSDGSMDSLLSCLASREGANVCILNTTLQQNEYYLRYLSKRIQDPDMKSLVTAGVLPLVSGLIDIRKSASVVLLAYPYLMNDMQCEVQPEGRFYLLSEGLRDSDMSAIYSRNKSKWSSLSFRDNVPAGSVFYPLAAYIYGNYSRIANDLGVVLDKYNKSSLASEAYRAALSLDTNNITALLNIGSMPHASVAEKGRYEEVMSDGFNKAGLGAMVRRYGMLRRGLLLGDKKNAALSDLEIRYDNKSSQNFIAVGLALDAEILFSDTLTKELVESGRFAISGGGSLADSEIVDRLNEAKSCIAGERYKEAADILDQLRPSADKCAHIADLLSVLSLFRQGLTSDGDASLQALILAKPNFALAWVALADQLYVRSDVKGLEAVIARLERSEGDPLALAYSRGIKSIFERDYSKAGRFMHTALLSCPGSEHLRNLALYTSMKSGDWGLIKTITSIVLSLDSGNMLANYALAKRQIKYGEADLAVTSLERSLRRERTGFALNDLAWQLCSTGACDKAEGLALECVAANPARYESIDTLGVVYMAQGRFIEACEALKQAYELSGRVSSVGLNYAEALLKHNDPEMCKRILAEVSADSASLSKQDKRKIKAIKRKLK